MVDLLWTNAFGHHLEASTVSPTPWKKSFRRPRLKYYGRLTEWLQNRWKTDSYSKNEENIRMSKTTALGTAVPLPEKEQDCMTRIHLMKMWMKWIQQMNHHRRPTPKSIYEYFSRHWIILLEGLQFVSVQSNKFVTSLAIFGTTKRSQKNN